MRGEIKKRNARTNLQSWHHSRQYKLNLNRTTIFFNITCEHRLSNKIIFAPDSSIGNVPAETDDKFLFKCFVDHPALAAIRDMDNAKMFLLGSTGVGKTAFLRMIEKNDNGRFLELHDLSLSYFSNSDTIQFLRKIDVDISFFLQALWRHVICIELIKAATSIEDEGDTKGFLSNSVTAEKTMCLVKNF